MRAPLVGTRKRPGDLPAENVKIQAAQGAPLPVPRVCLGSMKIKHSTPKRRTPLSTGKVATTKPRKKAFLVTDRPVKNTMTARVKSQLVLNNPSQAPRRSATSL